LTGLTCVVLTTRIDAVDAASAATRVTALARTGDAAVVCAANVHMVMEAWDDPAFARQLASADLVVCDGRPVLWACWLDGRRQARQTRGYDLMLAVSAAAEKADLAVGFYGGESRVTASVADRLKARFPRLRVTYSESPPFRELSVEEDAAAVAGIGRSGTAILFVSLGCPKQERWMFAHRDRLPCVMIGVGAAFDMVAGQVPMAPHWLQRLGMEWLVRLAVEPTRLWRRYARHNLRFAVLVAWRIVHRA
jgi:N-acetylglucosaminyldiphosphoundecaprenol N-acetyl-beta-D-mannosaminyltransferase